VPEHGHPGCQGEARDEHRRLDGVPPAGPQVLAEEPFEEVTGHVDGAEQAVRRARSSGPAASRRTAQSWVTSIVIGALYAVPFHSASRRMCSAEPRMNPTS
jgi:hypothetical protein